jgi:long-chain acyl-CoA synthetase
MEKIWLQHYPAGIAATIDQTAVTTLRDLIEHSCRKYADHTAFSNFGTELSYQQMASLSADLAAWLQQRAGLQKGDRIALMMPNVLQYPLALYAALRAGFVVVNINPMYTADELHTQLSDSGARAIVVLENFAHTLETVLPRLQLDTVIISRIGDLLGPVKGTVVNLVVKHLRKAVPRHTLSGAIPLPTVLKQGRKLQFDPVPLKPADTACLQYTGGTTGIAKGAVLSHANLADNVAQLSQWLSILSRPGEEVVVTALPIYHIFSLTANILLFGQLGGHNLLITDPRDLKGFVRELARQPFTAITGVNTLFNALLHADGFAQLDFSRLHMTLGGGMAVQAAVAEHWQQVTGSTLIQAYGLTETSPGVCINPMNDSAFNGSVGPPLPSTEVSIRDADGAELAIGEDGELWIRGPQVMREYWHQADETASVLSADGWLRSGDIAHLDERGRVTLVDRQKDMILVSGFNVYPNEVEEVASRLAGVREVAAVSVPDPKSGEAVKLFVVRETDAGDVDADSIIAWCKQHLARYKVPHQVEFRDTLPKTNVGKILRRQLRDQRPPAE